MAENPKALKHGLGRPAVRRIARNIGRVEPAFAGDAFIASAMRGLDALELKARVDHVVAALREHLADDERTAIEVLVRAGADWEEGDPSNATSGFAAWPVIEFVGVHGLGHFSTSMAALRKLTGLFSSEFAIRGFIEQYPDRSLKLLGRWTGDKDPHVRRLVSEGTRPRLPWGRRLKALIDDPEPILGLLENLKDDDSEYVRRSVANNLNDIAKDHPETVVRLCRRWTKSASAERRWIVERATRTLVKQGHPAALELLGFDPNAKVEVDAFTLTPTTLRLGEELEFSFEIRSTSDRPQALLIDYAIHHVKKTGGRTAKVFKLKKLELGVRRSMSITRKHGIRKITTRTYYAGRHGLEILVNGRSAAMAEFDLKV